MCLDSQQTQPHRKEKVLERIFEHRRRDQGPSSSSDEGRDDKDAHHGRSRSRSRSRSHSGSSDHEREKDTDKGRLRRASMIDKLKEFWREGGRDGGQGTGGLI